MSSEWPVQRLDQIAEINPTRKVRKGSVVPFVDMAALPQFSRDIGVEDVGIREAKSAGAHFQNGDTLLARITPCLENGKTAQVHCLDGDAIAEGSTEFIVLCGKDLADNDFIYYLCREQAFREYAIGRMEGTSGRQRVSWQSIAAYEFAFPPSEERRAAARVLSTLDDRITLLRETNATLEAIAQALFKSWFVDFDPVRAKMEGRIPEGMDEATAALFPDGMNATEDGEIPAGWRMGSIRGVVSDVYDGPHATPPEASAGPVFLGIKNLTGTSLELADIRHISERDWVKWTKRVVPQAGDIVFSYEATLGFFALIPSDLRCCLGRRLALIRPKASNGAGHFWFHQFTALPFQQLLVKHTVQGATVNRIALKEFPSYKVLVPPVSLQMAFHDAASSLWQKIHKNQENATTLAALRDTLLPRLISGKLRLPEVQDAVQAPLATA